MEKRNEMTEVYLEAYSKGDYERCLFLLEKDHSKKDSTYYRLKGELQIEKGDWEIGLKDLYEARDLSSNLEEKEALSFLIAKTQLEKNPYLFQNQNSFNEFKRTLSSIESEYYQEEKALLQAKSFFLQGDFYLAIVVLKDLLPTLEQQTLYYEAMCKIKDESQARHFKHNVMALTDPSYLEKETPLKKESLSYVASYQDYKNMQQEMYQLLEQGDVLIPVVLEWIQKSDLTPSQKELLSLKACRDMLTKKRIEDAEFFLKKGNLKEKDPFVKKEREKLQTRIRLMKKIKK